MNNKDKQILRKLAEEIAEISQMPIMSERKKLWTNLNSLNCETPLVAISPEGAWREVHEMTPIECEDEYARSMEWLLKEKLHAFNFNDDRVLTNEYTIRFDLKFNNWGVDIKHDNPDAATGSYKPIPPLKNLYEDFEKLHSLDFTLDMQEHNRKLDIANDVFEGILDVVPRAGFNFWTCGLTSSVIELIGMESLLFGVYDEPENIHKLMDFLSKDLEKTLKKMESLGLIYYNNGANLVGSGTVGYTTDLASRENPNKEGIKLKDLWGLAESQETVGVSPEMFGEFIWPYQKRLMELFGLSYYGCCEDISERIDFIKEAKNLRALSIAPWANVEACAVTLGKDYVLSHKVNPANICVNFDEKVVREELKRRLEICKGLNNMFILKDTHTISYKPERFKRWVEIFKEERDKVYCRGNFKSI